MSTPLFFDDIRNHRTSYSERRFKEKTPGKNIRKEIAITHDGTPPEARHPCILPWVEKSTNR